MPGKGRSGSRGFWFLVEGQVGLGQPVTEGREAAGLEWWQWEREIRSGQRGSEVYFLYLTGRGRNLWFFLGVE